MKRKNVLIAVVLIGLGYLGGVATAPQARAYTEDGTRLMNNLVSEVRGIGQTLQRIERKLK